MKPEISVIFGSYNQKETLQKTLMAYENQTLEFTKFEVIVIDSSSTDGSQEFLKTFKPTYNFRYVIQKNVGKAAARNKGVELAKSELILITDADMIPEINLLKEHLIAHQKIQKPACFEGLTYNLKDLSWPIPQNPDHIAPYIQKNYANLAKLGWYYFLTGNLSLPKKLYLAENGFDLSFTGYGWEDLELGYRFEQKKIPLFYLKTAVNFHYHVIDESQEFARNFHKGASAKLMLTKHPELKMFLGINPISVGVYKLFKRFPRLFNYVKTKAFPEKNKTKFTGLFFYLAKEFNYLEGLLT